MNELSGADVFKIVYDLIVSSPLFLCTIGIGLIILLAMIISMTVLKKLLFRINVAACIFLVFFVVINFSDYFYKLFDNLINTIFIQIFFPSLATYALIIVLTVGILIYSCVSKVISKRKKVLNLIFSFIILIISIITFEMIAVNDINVYDSSLVYSNEILVALLEVNTFVFVFWMIILFSSWFMVFLINKSNKNIIDEFFEVKDGTEVLKI